MLISCIPEKYFWRVRLLPVCYTNQSTKHVVLLRWVWEHGAALWTQEKREKFANDPRNLWPVELSLNRSKGARGPEDWLPPFGRCQFIARFSRLIKIYDLNPADRSIKTETPNYSYLLVLHC